MAVLLPMAYYRFYVEWFVLRLRRYTVFGGHTGHSRSSSSDSYPSLIKMSSEETADNEKYPKRPLDNAQDWEWMKYKDQMRLVWKERLEKKLKRQEEKKAKRMKTEAEENAVLLARQRRWRGRQYTVSVALPGSIMDNAQSPELRTYLAGQVARALVVFNVDEVIIFDERGTYKEESTEGLFAGVGKKGQANVQLARLLQYLECPQYLRKNFFPMHNDLKYAGLLNPLDCPHHLRADQYSPFREGVISNYTPSKKKGSCVYIGLRKEARVDKQLQAGLRVTVQIDEDVNVEQEGKAIKGTVVAPSLPREQQGIYWGYTVRLASSLGGVFSESQHPDGYDLTIGTSEKGEIADDVQLPSFKHLLIVFGGLKGLEYSLDVDENLKIDEPNLLFDHYLNTCPGQGSRTIRTEEALLITMSLLRPKILQSGFSGKKT